MSYIGLGNPLGAKRFLPPRTARGACLLPGKGSDRARNRHNPYNHHSSGDTSAPWGDPAATCAAGNVSFI